MKQPPPSALVKRQFFVMFFAMVFATAIYAGVGYLIVQDRLRPPTGSVPAATSLTPPAPTAAPMIVIGVVYALALFNVAVINFWIQLRTGNRADDSLLTNTPQPLLTPREFLQVYLIALVFAESCALLGLVIVVSGGDLVHLAILGAVSLLIEFVYLLPRALRYWRAWEAQEATPPPSDVTV